MAAEGLDRLFAVLRRIAEDGESLEVRTAALAALDAAGEDGLKALVALMPIGSLHRDDLLSALNEAWNVGR